MQKPFGRDQIGGAEPFRKSVIDRTEAGNGVSPSTQRVPTAACVATEHFFPQPRMSMTEILIAARAALILWVNLAVMPAEFVFDSIEAELERRGIDPRKIGTNGD